MVALPELARLIFTVRASIADANRRAELARAIELAKKEVSDEMAKSAVEERPSGDFWKKAD